MDGEVELTITPPSEGGEGNNDSWQDDGELVSQGLSALTTAIEANSQILQRAVSMMEQNSSLVPTLLETNQSLTQQVMDISTRVATLTPPASPPIVEVVIPEPSPEVAVVESDAADPLAVEAVAAPKRPKRRGI